MVKVDYARDYYADLDLTSSASLEDIKSQYHKLAKKYHPDRNHGHENEFNSRFQDISAAYEVLKDPDQRAKYDANRRRGNVNNNFNKPAPPRKTNPMYQATSNFPPPPRRANPQSSPPASRNGADRYTRWAGPPPPPRERPQAGNHDAKEKANVFHAWQQMNNAQKQQTHPQRRAAPTSPATPSQPPPRPTSMPRGASSTSPPRSAYEAINVPNSGIYRSANPNANHNSNPSRRPRFDPSIPLGDEGPARAGPSLYSSGPRYPASAAHPPHPPPPVPSPPPRYAAPTAKKADPGPPGRSHPGDDDPRPQTFQRTKSSYPANVPDQSYFNPEMIQRSNSFRDATKLRQGVEQRHQRGRSASPPSQKKNDTTSNEPRPRPVSTANVEFERQFSSEESSDEDESDSDMQSEPETSKPATSSADNKGLDSDPLAQADSKWHNYAPHPGPTSSFTFPIQDDTFSRTSSSNRNIEQATRDPEISPTNIAISPPGIHRAESHPNMFALRGQQQGPARPPLPSAQVSGGEFPAEQWAKSVQEENWAARWADPSGRQSSPPKTGSRRHRGPVSRSGTNDSTSKPITPQPASVEEEERGDPNAFTGGQRTNSPDSRDAMDIDDEELALPSTEGPPIMLHDPPDGQGNTRGALLNPTVSNDQSRGAVNGSFERRPSLPDNISSTSNARPVSQQPRLSPQLSLDSFRHVQPFKVGESRGLQSMSNLSSELPFPSQPGDLDGIENDSDKVRLALPKMPKPPLPPQRLTQDIWAFYLEQMYKYLAEWNKFNSIMMSYFSNRANTLNAFEKGSAGVGVSVADGGDGVMHGWLGAVGETKDLKGWNTYMANMEEDQRWRTHWQVGCDKHADTLERHGRLRERVMKGALHS